MKINPKTLAFLMCFAALPTQKAAAISLYNQAVDTPDNGSASQNDTAGGGFGNFATTYDNFTLATSANITDVQWVGAFFNGSPSTITNFTIQFWADSSGQPGASLLSQFGFSNANETLLSGQTYTYGATLTTAFQAQAGTQYWLSIVPDLGFPPQWGWNTGSGGDGSAYQDFLGSRSPKSVDFAFSLSGNPVPEPASILLFGTALAGLMATQRRRPQNGTKA